MIRTLVHETWGDHAALIARTEAESAGSVGRVISQTVDVAMPENPLALQYGERLEQVTVTYETYGELNATKDNAILICHALTGSAHAAGIYENDLIEKDPDEKNTVPGWWDPLIGPGKPVDTEKYFVVCSNILGGCYGTTGPTSVNPTTNQSYRLSFPRYTVRDVVEVQKHLMDKLEIESFKSVLGGSMGGMQVLEWAAMYPERVRSIIPIAIGARHSAWAIGLNEVARRSIMSDPAWQSGNYAQDHQPETGLGLARAIAMLSYRSFESLESKFGRERVSDARALTDVSFKIESYLSYQGVKLVKRFDANTYLYITRAMDDHDIAEGRGKLSEVLRKMKMPALVMGINSDVLYPESEQKELVEYLPNAQYARINSPHGHDSFLIEFPQVAVRVRKFLSQVL
jgi:homoserine O-acetyltransferase/O-succinyltransferase